MNRAGSPRYEGRHRDDSFAAAAASRRRDRMARLLGQLRTPRHEATPGEQAA